MPPTEVTSIYAEPRVVTDLGQCAFYHTMDLPGHGTVAGEVDLRGCLDAYLGGVDVRGKRVLDIGTSSGFLCFEMERRGAEVVAFDLSEEFDGDAVPFAAVDMRERRHASRSSLRQFNDAFWLAHRALGSHARLVHGTGGAIPEAIGAVDVAVFGLLLPLFRDPIRALECGCRLTRETVIVTEVISRRWLPFYWLGLPIGIFLPHPARPELHSSWWVLTPAVVRRALGVFGFEDSRVTHHRIQQFGRSARAFTIVARRTTGRPAVD
jgi:SAM-dependent methyltransferase